MPSPPRPPLRGFARQTRSAWRFALLRHGLALLGVLALLAHGCTTRTGDTLGGEESARLLREATDSASRGALPAALSALKRLTRARDTPAEAYDALAAIYDRINWPDEGLIDFDELRREKPEEAAVLFYAAHFRASFPKRHDEAVDLFQAALARDPGRAMSYDGFARFLHQRQDYSRELSVVDEALKRFPDDATFSTLRGLALLRRGEIDAAAAAFRALAEASPEELYAWLNLGYLEFGRGNLDEASRCFGKVLAIQGDNTEALYNVGRIALRRGDAANAWRASRALRAATHAD